MSARLVLLGALGAATSAFAAPAAAQVSLPPQPASAITYPPGWEQARADWLAECRSRHGSGNRVGGAVRDWCGDYLERHTTWSYGSGYGHAPMTIMVPAAYAPAPAAVQSRECQETVETEEWVPVAQPARIRPRRAAIPDKRVRSN